MREFDTFRRTLSSSVITIPETYWFSSRWKTIQLTWEHAIYWWGYDLESTERVADDSRILNLS